MKVRNSLVLVLALILMLSILFTGCQQAAVPENGESIEIDAAADENVTFDDVEEYGFWDYWFGYYAPSYSTTQKATQKATQDQTQKLTDAATHSTSYASQSASESYSGYAENNLGCGASIGGAIVLTAICGVGGAALVLKKKRED